MSSCSGGKLNISSYEYQPKMKSQIFSSDEQLIGEVYNENRTYVQLEKIPKDLQKAIVAVEDSRFYKHSGFDIIRIVKAVMVDIKSGQLKEGASTITQQLAKNLFLTNEKSFVRKFKELIYSIQLERKYTKDEILEMYLNEIYLGQLIYGVQEASTRYLGKDVWDLSLAESAFIAGLPQAPSAYDPTKHFERAKKRQEVVLNRMAANEDITQTQADAAKKEEITIIESKDRGFKGKYKNGDEHFVNQVINQLISHFSKEIETREKVDSQEAREMAEYQINNGGYKIHTTLKQSLQDQAIAAIQQGLKNYGLGEHANGVMVSIEPNTGRVLSYYGGLRDIDMAKKARQPGSTIKPLYFAGAINDGTINDHTIVLDEPTNFNGYEPKNFGDKYMGYVTTREALVHSLNNASVKVMDYMGVESAIEYLQKFGMSHLVQEDRQLATALGGMTQGITPIELANAYGVLANDGVYKEAYFIEKVEDLHGNIIYSKEEQNLETRQVLSVDTAAQVTDMLTDVVNRGTAQRARLPYYTAGKTGTTDSKKDLWFVGYLDNLVTSVWLGNEDNQALQGGSSIAADIYGKYNNSLLKNKLIATEGLQVVTTYDDTTQITIVPPDKDINQLQNLTEEDVAEITIPTNEISYFEDRLVEKVSIDKVTGMRFVEGRCPEENREVKIYLQGQAPQEECTSPHIIDRFQDFYNNLWNKPDPSMENQESFIRTKKAA